MGVMPDGSVVITGPTGSDDLPVTSAAIKKMFVGGEGWMAMLSGDLSELIYGTYIGGSGGDVFRALAVNTDGTVGLAGVTDSADFPFTNAFDTMLKNDTSGNNQAGTYVVLTPVP